MVQIKPDYYGAWYNCGISLIQLRRFEAAVASFNKALEIKPDYHQALHSRGFALRQLGRFKEAVESFDKALEIKSNYLQAWFNRGIALIQLGQFEPAIESFDKALEIKPDYHQAWNNKGIVFLYLGRPGDAFRSLDRATSFSKEQMPWRNRAEASLILAAQAISEESPNQLLHYLNESRKSEPIIGVEQWNLLALETLLSEIPSGKILDMRKFIIQAGLDKEFFPLIRAIDYLETGNEDLVEKLSPEYRKIVTDVAKALKSRK